MALHAFILLSFRQMGRYLKRIPINRRGQNSCENEAMSGSNNRVPYLVSNQHIEQVTNKHEKIDNLAALPTFDPQLGIQLTFGDPEIWNTVLGMLFDNLPDSCANLNASRHNMENLRQTAHKLVSASCYTGTPAMNQAARQVEHFAKAGNMEAANQALDILLQQIECLLILKNGGNLHTTAIPAC
ncbi:MAG: Hpt domain-containing protein [Pseudomonadota bacterium]